MSELPLVIRHAQPADHESLEVIETAADALLIDLLGAGKWPASTGASERAAAPGFVLVAEDATAAGAVVGFTQVLEIDGHAHLEQLSVLPAYGRRGIGRRLLSAALSETGDRGYSRITLRTYAEVPWNAPFYASCGFLMSLPETPFLRQLVETESRLGLDAYGRRVQMTAEL